MVTRSIEPTKLPLAKYNEKRNFKLTAEPAGTATPTTPAGSRFVIQKHWASRLHYDFRLELDGVLLSWALPKGPSFDPKEKRMAIHVEDHPVSYAGFEGTIPPKQYGAGRVIVWDHGTWEPVGDPRQTMLNGKVLFKLHGQKLAGLWELVRISKPDDKQDQWMLFKKKDEWARPASEYDVITALPDSVVAAPMGLVEQREGRTAHAAAPPPTADLSAAKKAPLPTTLAPQLATLASAAPTGGGWLAETKFDGYRFLTRVQRGQVKMLTRNGHDWTSKMATLASAIAELGIDSAWLDGEVVVLDESGLPNFGLLQNALNKPRNDEVVLFVFDAPFFGGMDLRHVPLGSRRSLLRELFALKSSERVRFSEDFAAPPGALLEAACGLNLEGIMLKRQDAPYVSGRTETWLKLKCSQRQEFVIVGFTDRSGAKSEVGGLLLGYHEEGKLRYAGSVGTGWDGQTGRDLHKLLTGIEVREPTVDPATVKPGRWSKRTAGNERWVRPELVAEVAFTEWTADGHVRHPAFKGLRSDKPASAISREIPKEPAINGVPARPGTGQRFVSSNPSSTIKISNPERVIDPSTGLRKLDLVHYYESVAEWMLPHLKDRPVSLVRAPEGITGELFFQKHPETRMPGLTVLDPELWPGHASLLGVGDAAALVSAAQMNVVEFHTWNSTTRHIGKPDRVIFDLDPGEGVSWAHLQEAAMLMQALLAELGLKAWLKTSGGKGLHVVVPLSPRLGYDVVKGFSQAAVQHMAKTIPERFVAKSGGTNRVGRIFIDYLRNGHSQTTASAFSARSRPGMGVSMPVSWDQLATLKSGAQWTVATAREYLSFQQSDPWADYWKSRQTLTRPMKALGYTPKPGQT